MEARKVKRQTEGSPIRSTESDCMSRLRHSMVCDTRRLSLGRPSVTRKKVK